MTDFNTERQALRTARLERELAAANALLAREQVKRLDTRRKELERVFDEKNDGHLAQRKALEQAQNDAAVAAGDADSALKKLGAAEASAFKNFTVFTDPLKNIAQLDDQIPLLLLPVRLETRFRRVNNVATELWVRVYPDDCSIDTFEPELSEMELKNTQLYWLGIFQAGKVTDQERGAWRELVGDHGSGRAEWLAANYVPANAAARPAKATPQDVILTIATETALADPNEIEALSKFWVEVWNGSGDAATSPARQTLIGSVGEERAKELIAAYVPSNLLSTPPFPLKKSDVTATVAFVVFPPAANIRRHSWSRPARVNTLPDRFVFIGQNTGAPSVVLIGEPVPPELVVGPSPSAPEAGELMQDANGDLIIPEEMKWMVDFDLAVKVGMGFRINLGNATNGFERVLVAGVRLDESAEEGEGLLRTLLEHHQFSRTGLSIVPQGTPTNNIDTGTSGYTRAPDADASFDRIAKGILFNPDDNPLLKRDGQWLAEYLGLPYLAFDRVAGADTLDQHDARAMNIALWPATLGYWMETMMAPVFSDAAVDETRNFFERYVSGRGAIPALRIGRQPYGILPATALSKMAWFVRRPDTTVFIPTFLGRLWGVLKLMDADWKGMSDDVSFAGKPGSDPHKTLLDIVGLHPVSAELSQRWLESLVALYNRMNLEGFGALVAALILGGLKQSGIDLLGKLGYKDTANPPDILEKIFFGKHNLLKGPVIDDVPLSETSIVRPYATGNRNYLQWLADAARKSLDTLYQQDDFTDGAPNALLYLLLRHSLQLGFHDASAQLHVLKLLIPSVQAVKRDDPFIHIKQGQQQSESRYQLLYKRDPQLTGNNDRVGDFIAQRIELEPFNARLLTQVRAIERLAGASTARLERAFIEHVDLCTYRLDAWILGLLHAQLEQMRQLATPKRRMGIYLGAYAWLEEVRPQNRVLTPVKLTDPELIAAFQAGPPLTTDSANEGFVHAPSLNHAVAAAVLRSGYTNNATPANPQTMAVNLTSERVRGAMAIIEGIRGGQSLGALLGYQFERGLHDRHNFAEVDAFIFDLRREFPLGGNRLASTADPDAPISAVEARNVLDGLALVNWVKDPAHQATYDFGIARLPNATAAQEVAINAEVERLLETHDAVADLALAEGVYQAVLGNYDRVGSTYDAYSKGNFPPEPQVVRTPTSGSGVTHRVALHLDPAAAAGTTPRSKGEPATAAWIASVFPPLASIGCLVTYLDAATLAAVTLEVRLDVLGLEAVDLLELIRDGQQEMAELDDRIVRHVVTSNAVRPDEPVTIAYMQKNAAALSVFETIPLVRHLKQLLRRARPLVATDLAISHEATAAADEAVASDPAPLEALRAELGGVDSVATDLDAFIAATDAALAAADPPALAAAFDGMVAVLGSILGAAARFNIPQTGWGFAYETRQRLYRSILARNADAAARWTTRLAEFNGFIAAYGALPADAPDSARYDLLTAAERLISTTISPAAPPDDIRDALVTTKKPAFEARLAQMQAVANTSLTTVSALLAEVQAQPSLAPFDFIELSYEQEERDIVLFAEDVSRVAKTVRTEVQRRVAAAQTAFAAHAAAASAAAQAAALTSAGKALLGEDFVVIPRFTLPALQGEEVEKALAATASGALLDHVANALSIPFPVDTWLYGAARVRDQLRAWEQVTLLADAFSTAAPELTPLQLPVVPNDPWMALQFPPGTKLDFERLCYTAAFTVPFAKDAPQCALLVDEWSEIIPEENLTTGVAVHFDRPNSEAPQSMLLVTPTSFTGQWTWSDVVDALNETLDFAKRRAVEPVHVDNSPYARFLPATVMAVTVAQISISANIGVNNFQVNNP
jgi:hypothetical protein